MHHRVAGNDVKDKSELTEARRKIERQMEKFKECEKEMKTKAFSKEGLGRMQKVDPREKEKLDRMDWLNEKVDELTSTVRSNKCSLCYRWRMEKNSTKERLNDKQWNGKENIHHQYRMLERQHLHGKHCSTHKCSVGVLLVLQSWHAGYLDILMKMEECIKENS